MGIEDVFSPLLLPPNTDLSYSGHAVALCDICVFLHYPVAPSTVVSVGGPLVGAATSDFIYLLVVLCAF